MFDIETLWQDRKARKVILTLFCIGVLIIGIVAQVVSDMHVAAHGVFEYEDLGAYRKYGADLNFVARRLLSRYEDELRRTSELSVIMIRESADCVTVSRFDRDFRLLSEDAGDLDAVTLSRISAVARNAFPREKARFSDIRISRDQVAFVTYGPYLLIYARHRPSYVCAPSDRRAGASYYISAVCPLWYRAIREV